MSEEEKKAIDFFIHECEKYDGTIEIKGTSVGEETRILNTVVKFLKELNSLKEIEQSHQEENGKLRVEFEKVYEDNLTLAHELEQEKEKNKELEKDNKNLNILLEAKYKDVTYMLLNYISKDKIKEKIEETNNEKLNYSEDEYYLENEIKGYAIDKLKELLEGEI